MKRDLLHPEISVHRRLTRDVRERERLLPLGVQELAANISKDTARLNQKVGRDLDVLNLAAQYVWTHALFSYALRNQLREARGFDFVEIEDYKEFQWGATLLRDATGNDTMFRITLNLAAYEVAGRHLYVPSTPLAEYMAHGVQAPRVTSEDLRLPFPAVFLAIPEHLGYQVWNEDTGWHRCVGVYVVEGRARDLQNNPCRGWQLMMVGEDKAEGGLVDDAVYYCQVPLTPGLTIQQSIDRADAHYQGMDPGYRNHRGWRDVFMWAVNIILYCTYAASDVVEYMANPDAARLVEKISRLKRGQRKRQLQDKLDRQGGERRRYRVGHDIVIDRGRLVGGETSGAHQGSPVQARHWVTGHWKMQTYGAGRLQRRLTWIAPYKRGPTGQELVERKRVVKGDVSRATAGPGLSRQSRHNRVT